MTQFPDLLPAFPHTAEFIVNGRPTLHDVDFQPSCGYVSIDEARILYGCARAFAGVWCEIGSHTGFSGAHIAHGLREPLSPGDRAYVRRLVAIDPQYVYLDFFARTRENWGRAGVDETIFPIAATSTDYFKGCQETFVGGFIDGDHEPGKPLEDARLLLPHLAERAVVVFHDGVGEPVWEGARFMEHQGFRLREFDTMARLLVCWRGADNWEPTL